MQKKRIALRTGPSPRTRGCFRTTARKAPPAVAFPAHAGMFPAGPAPPAPERRLPRARGDVSASIPSSDLDVPPSPRTRGCFQKLEHLCRCGVAFPVHAGMFLSRFSTRASPRGLPRARGDVSIQSQYGNAQKEPSPRTRGCFLRLTFERYPYSAFPAHAGMFPPCRCGRGPLAGLPRARGDVSGRQRDL